MSTSLMPFVPADQIENTATETLKKHQLYAVPVNPVAVAEAEGVKVFRATFADEGVSGIFRKSDGKCRIFVNANHSPNRARYTIAHELGHYFLHSDDDSAFVDPDINLYRNDAGPAKETTRGRMEIQANLFAASILMPEELVRDEYSRCQDVSELASRFGVSRSAMGFRINNLGLA